MQRQHHPLTNANVGSTRGAVLTEDASFDIDYSHHEYIRSMWPGETVNVYDSDNAYDPDVGIRHQNSGLDASIHNGYQRDCHARNWRVIDILASDIPSNWYHQVAIAIGISSEAELNELAVEQDERIQLAKDGK